MTETGDRIAAMVRHFERIEREHMQGLPILNPELAVEATEPREFGEHVLFILLSPWFMNLVLLPGTDDWDSCDPGACIDIEFPYQALEFSVSHDAELGTFLSSMLFRSVTEFPDQASAIVVATEVMQSLFSANPDPDRPVGRTQRKLSRRSLLTGLGSN